MDWSKVPDLAAVALLACAFASVVRRNRNSTSGIWLTGWILICLHFAACMFLPAPGIWGTLANLAAMTSLTAAGVLFMWASVPFRGQISSRWILASFLGTNTLYILLMILSPGSWTLIPAAAMLGGVPLTIAITNLRSFSHPLRWIAVSLYSALSIFLLVVQFLRATSYDLPFYAILFTVYFGCCIQFWYVYRRATAGALITIAGFLAWASVFAVAPAMMTFLPQVHVESEVWNLPKFLVAAGMILLLLEDQIEHNRHLALHDHLTGLPNRRLFHDRLYNAIERARRSGTQTALLVVDLDGFKQVNDTLGHHAGDLVLQHVAAMFSARVRRSDTVARTGGDEFSVILEDPTSRDRAHHVADSLLRLLQEPILLPEDELVRIGASAGVAVFPEDAPDMNSLCIAADLRMYGVKHGEADSDRVAFATSPLPGPRHHSETVSQVGD